MMSPMHEDPERHTNPKDIDIDRLLSFIGYGSLAAPLWFLGMEESLGPRPGNPGWTVEWELEVRSQWDPIMDVREAHVQLQDAYWERRNYSQVWRFMAKLARGLLHRAPDWRDTNLAHTYVIDHLGRARGKTLLGEAMPLPAASVGHWPYAALFPKREKYWEDVWPMRRDLWHRLIRAHRPRFLIAYGKRYWPYHQELLGGIEWQDLASGQIRCAIMPHGGRAYLLPFMGQGALRSSALAAIIEDAGHNAG